MGVSTDGLLFYGFEVGGAESDVDHLNYLRLYDNYKQERTQEEIDETWKTLDNDYGDSDLGDGDNGLDFLQKQGRYPGIKLVNSCSGDYPVLYLTHEKTYTRASRGYPKEIDVPSLQSKASSVIEELKQFCLDMHIPWQEPKWLLGSYWG